MTLKGTPREGAVMGNTPLLLLSKLLLQDGQARL